MRSDIINDMTTQRPLRAISARLGLAIAALVIAVPTPAAASRAHPKVSEYAWYWEDQRSDTIKVGETEVVEYRLQNPYCAETPAGGVRELCKAGRLPVEVQRGDYEKPNKISAVAFDFTGVPFGSRVKIFRVTFVEADDPESQPLNAAGKALRACRVKEFFGTGEAREYKERPEFECTKSDPVAKRKLVGRGDDKVHKFTFDLTAYAKRWARQGSLVTGVMLYPVKPKHDETTGGIGFGDDDPNQSAGDSWKVVLKGPETKQGIESTLVYKKPKPPSPVPPGPPPAAPPTFTGGTGTSGFSDFGSTGTTGFTTPSTGSESTTSPVSPEVPSPVPTPTPAPSPVEAIPDDKPASAVDETPVEGFPWYMWLALLAGIVGFSMVRSIVVEHVGGIRPNGVLAHIHRLNALRRGAQPPSAAAAGTGLLTPVAAALRPVGQRLASFGRAAGGAIAKVRRKA